MSGLPIVKPLGRVHSYVNRQGLARQHGVCARHQNTRSKSNSTCGVDHTGPGCHGLCTTARRVSDKSVRSAPGIAEVGPAREAGCKVAVHEEAARGARTPENALCPAGQGAHWPPACEPWRSAQRAHAAASLDELPAGQGAHAALPAAEEVPGEQGMHAALPRREGGPGGSTASMPRCPPQKRSLPCTAWQRRCRRGQKLPAGHGVQALSLLGEKVPGRAGLAAAGHELAACGAAVGGTGADWLRAGRWRSRRRSWGMPAAEAATGGQARGACTRHAGYSSRMRERAGLPQAPLASGWLGQQWRQGPAGACCVAQQAVRPLSRAPLRLSKNKLWRYGHRYVTKSERVRTDMTVSSLAAIHKHPQGRLVRQQALSAQAGL